MAAVLAAGGCSEPPDTLYGNSNILSRSNIPGDGGAEPLSCTGAQSVASRFDGGCPTFATDIFPYVRGTGKWKCADATCHGETTSPKIDGNDPATALSNLKAIMLQGKSFIVAGANGPNQSMMMCNVQGACGSQMPKAPGTALTPDEICMVSAWLECGAN